MTRASLLPVQRTSQLLAVGPYRVRRNPLYLAFSVSGTVTAQRLSISGDLAVLLCSETQAGELQTDRPPVAKSQVQRTFQPDG